MTLRHSEKHTRYTQLKIDWEANGWKVHPLCVEIECRGHMSQSFEWMCKVPGLTKDERNKLKYEVEKAARHCGHAIVTAQYQKEWIPKALLDVSKWYEMITSSVATKRTSLYEEPRCIDEIDEVSNWRSAILHLFKRLLLAATPATVILPLGQQHQDQTLVIRMSRFSQLVASRERNCYVPMLVLMLRAHNALKIRTSY